LNGVDLERLADLTARYEGDPESGREGFSAQVQWLGGNRTISRLGEHELLRGDEPEALGGTNTGPSPEELLLAAVGQCLSVGYAGSAASAGIEIESLEIEVRGRVNFAAAYGVEPGNPGFDRIEVDVRLVADASDEELSRLHDKVVALAPIPNTITRPIELEARLTS
jgi:uncharacterized OsmC-like protein